MREPLFQRGELVAGQYEVRALLGGGAMGQVFEVHDIRLNRRVALKAAFPHLDAGLLQREAQGLAAVRHPGVVCVHALGEHRGIHYFVMERLLGVSLEDHLVNRRAEAGALTVDEVIDVLAPLAEALAAVHAAGIAHRDVKPANVMLTVDRRVVLTDFSIVAAERAVRPDAPASGTAEYMAPETIAGTTTPGNAFLVDVYAFGVLAFELVTGAGPFEAASPRESLARHITTTPPPMARLRDGVPPLLDGLVRELLAKDPFDRPQSMDSVAARLRDFAMRSPSATRSSNPSIAAITLPPPLLRHR